MATCERILNEMMNKIIVEKEYKDYDLEIKPICSGGANITSHIFEATITSKERANLNLFVKVAAIGSKLRAHTDVRIYATELQLYTTLAKVYQRIEDEHGLLEEHRFGIPKLYIWSPTVPQETLVLENLTNKGFTIHDRMKCVGWEYAAAAVGELAKLHALSIAYQHERPEEFENLSEDFKFNWQGEGHVRLTFLKAGVKASLAVVKEENKDKLMKFFDGLNIESLEKQYRARGRSVITHGDYKPSNLLYRINQDGRMQFIVVDYQAMRLGTPVVDLFYFIFSGTDEQFRAQHYERLLDHYHAQLSLALRRLHLDPDEKYSREDFEYDLKEKLPLGLMIAVWILPMITVEENNAPIISAELHELSNFSVQETSQLFEERINGVINDFVKWGVLK